MAITIAYTGSAVTVSTTELSLVSGTTTLQNISAPGVIQVMIDTTNMAGTDQYNIYIKDKIVSGGTQRVIYTITVDGAQTGPIVTPTLILYYGWDVTMIKIAGTDRTFSWSIRKAG
jgi:hypothetical protein